MVRRIALFASLLFAATALAQQRPAFTVQSGGVVAAALPAALLDDVNVRKQLGSGLTTTFLLTARQGGRDPLAAARVEIRYDLWDDVWIVRRTDLDRKIDQQRLSGRDALERWWRTPLRLFATTADRVTLQLDLTVLPFSAAEEDDARQWIAKSGGVASGGGAGSGLVGALIGTTIAARPLMSRRWNVEVRLK